MRCLTPFIFLGILVLLVLSGYNYLQIGRINAELAAIKANARGGASAVEQEDLLSALESAGKHAEQAQVLIRKGKSQSAQHELVQSLRKLERASSLTRKMGKDAGSNVDSTLKTFRRQVENAVGSISKELDKQKSEGKRRGSGE